MKHDSPMRGKNFLVVVDGDPDRRRKQAARLRRLVRAEGCSVVTCASAREAIERLARATDGEGDRGPDRYRDLIDLIPDGLLVRDPDGVILYANRACCDRMGFAPEEMIGRPIQDFLPPRAPVDLAENNRRLAAERAIRFETGVGTRDGTPFAGEIMEQAIEWNGRPAVLCVGRDISRQKATETALRQSEERFRSLVQASPLAVHMLDLEGRIVFWNKASERMFGWTAEEVQGGPMPIVPEERLAEHVALRRKILAGGRVSGVRLRRRRKDGSEIDISLHTALMHDDQDRPSGIMGVIMDLTERKQIEERLRHKQKMEAIGQLAGGIAHDFNNLLTGILGYANLLKIESQPGVPVHEAAVTIEQAANRASQLIRQLMRLSRRDRVASRQIDLNDIAREGSSLLEHAFDKNITIRLRLDGRPVPVLGDASQMQQVLLNLAVNARDAMPEGGLLTIGTGRRRFEGETDPEMDDPAPGDYVWLSVTDNGCGIAPELLDRIFEPFFTTKERGKGAGMGLSTVYGIVRNHGGCVRVESTPDRGSTFCVYLPLAAPVGAVEAAGENSAPIAGKGRVLLVDDEKVIRDLVSGMLRKLGYEVVTAEDGLDGLERFQADERRFDLVILDLVMPRMNGRDCYKAMRRDAPDVR
ncbi:MAG: PAS domain S-box protein, partial [bacterium]|nr:PAS domain S-box protein [bacterium]